MAWLQLKNLTFGYGGTPLLEEISLQIEPGERIGLLGRNGAGKSTLMKLIVGELHPDSGEVERPTGLRIARLAQEVPTGHNRSVFEEVAQAFGAEGERVARIHTLTLQPEGNAAVEQELAELHSQVDGNTAWQWEHQIESVLARMSIDPLARFDSLSSGLKRRVLLAKALVSSPDILLLDEPTNHLDLNSIQWLEEFLLNEAVTILFVTHDRAFLQRLATRIIEVERARIFDWSCDYQNFVMRKEAALDAEAQQQALFDKRLAEEEIWIRKGVKARRVRNQGRVRALEAMREERRNRRERTGNVRMQVQELERSGALVVNTQGVGHSYGDRTVIQDLETTVFRGHKIGILGPNGAGKTTLLRILLGDLIPNSGMVKLGTNLQIAYYDQLRAQLDEEKTAADVIGEGDDHVLINGKPRHVLGYLNDFLFSGGRARTLVRYLSGGERNRLMLAKMFSKPANLLVLDEPTNDLDAETLELLEELLVEYTGTILVVSHDRAFLDNVVTSTLVFEGDGRVREFVGGYSDWERARLAEVVTTQAAQKTATKGDAARDSVVIPARKLSFKEQRELDALPQRIDVLEQEQQQLHAKLAEPNFYQQSKDVISATTRRLQEVEIELESALSRWLELEPSKS